MKIMNDDPTKIVSPSLTYNILLSTIEETSTVGCHHYVINLTYSIVNKTKSYNTIYVYEGVRLHYKSSAWYVRQHFAPYNGDIDVFV